MRITVYTDGSAKGNPGPGGYGIVLLSEDGHRKEVAKGYRMTTNNRMELLSVIVALEMLKNKPLDVTVFSDSKYVVDAVRKNGFLTGKRNTLIKRKIQTFGSDFYVFTDNIEFVLPGLRGTLIMLKTSVVIN